ncbi:glycosyltransferase family 2 protein [Bosea sp. MMO-172]|uniref:glycosyltransferase family 2 protein n=1 Tax=Bosea sp. MMO-172 TaxID=3127885 RepID=UPI0030192221
MNNRKSIVGRLYSLKWATILTKRVALTIGMPVFNGGKYVHEALSSLLAMTGVDFQVFVSDNCSTDDTPEKVRQVAGEDSRVSYFRHDKNVGAYANFSGLLDHAESDFFMWAAHDDLWRPTFAATLIAALVSDPDAAFAIPRWITRSMSLGPVGGFEPPGDMRIITSEDPIERVLKFTEMLATSHKDNLVYGMWRTSIIKSVLTTFPYQVIGGAMCQHILAQHRGVWVNEVLFEKRYAGLAPGHPLDKPHRSIMALKARLRGVRRGPDPYNRQTYIDEITVGLRAAGFPEEQLQHIDRIHE